MRHLARFACVTSLLSFACASAHASTVTENLNFTFTDFIDVAGNVPPPITTITGSFTVTFDPTQTYTDVSSGLIVNSLSDTEIDSPIVFSYDPTRNLLSVGGSNGGPGDVYAGTNDLDVNFNVSNLNAPTLSLCSDPGFSCGTATGSQSSYGSAYTLAAYPDDAWVPTVANGISASPTPEPTSLMLLGSGLASLGAMRFRRRK